MKTILLVLIFSLSSTAFAFKTPVKGSTNPFQVPEVNLMTKQEQRILPDLIAEINPIVSVRGIAKNRKQKRA